MTLEERMAMIDEKVKKDKEKVLEENEKYEKEYDNCYKEIQKLRERISDILKLANYAMDNGISLKHYDVLHGDYTNGDFFSNSWSHHLGLKDRNHLGYTKGGACGNIDFYTDGNEIYGFNTDKQEKTTPLLNDMKRFLEGFDKFENSFYEYIEKKCKQ